VVELIKCYTEMMLESLERVCICVGMMMCILPFLLNVLLLSLILPLLPYPLLAILHLPLPLLAISSQWFVFLMREDENKNLPSHISSGKRIRF
jgi:hypothetical protein